MTNRQILLSELRQVSEALPVTVTLIEALPIIELLASYSGGAVQNRHIELGFQPFAARATASDIIIPDPLPQALPAKQPENKQPRRSLPRSAAAKPVAKTPSRAGQPWSAEEKGRAKLLRAQGCSVSEVADQLQRPKTAVAKMLSDLAKTSADQPAASAKAQASVEDIAKTATTGSGVTGKGFSALTGFQRQLVDHLRGLDRSFEPEDDAYLVESVMAGIDAAQIADQLGCDVATVNKRWRKMKPEFIFVQDGKLLPGALEDLVVAAKHRVGGNA